jgi:hypothetical protein
MVRPKEGLCQHVPPFTVALLMVETFASLLMPTPPRPARRVFDFLTLAYRALLRYLIKILIIALFLLSAVTFSTETIPNFQPDCEVSFARKAPVLRSIKKIVLPRPLLPLWQEKAVLPGYLPSPPVLPPARVARFTTPSRAPPTLLN